jgi:DNA-binding NarL/FixJ family response regulator
VRASHLPDATFVRVPFGGAADARLWILGGAQSAAERIALVRTVMPALRAGLATWVQLGARRAALARLLDAGAAAVLAFDTRGARLHESAAGARLLADESGVDASRIRDAARQLALVAAHARADSTEPAVAPTVRTARHRYELAATRSATLFGREPVIVVSLRRQAPAALDDAALRERFALTRREIQVARLLAEGLSNVEVAERMGVSFFTARNHVERLLRKLGVSNRARVGALLRDDAD